MSSDFITGFSAMGTAKMSNSAHKILGRLTEDCKCCFDSLLSRAEELGRCFGSSAMFCRVICDKIEQSDEHVLWRSEGGANRWQE
jgi:hypothetical protein